MENFHSEETITTPEEPKKRSAVLQFLLEILQTLILAVVLYFLIDTVVARVRVENISMEPTLMPGEFLLVNKITYRVSPPQRGDIIVFHYPLNPSEDYIKRIIGLAGDRVVVQNQQVRVNDVLVKEAYISAEPIYEGTWDVPANSLFVLGDNRNQSSDSHSWGFVPIANVVGKALVVYFPFNQVKVLTHPYSVNAAN